MKQTAVNIVRRLREAGHTAYFAGGCVRDMVRGIEAHDFDIATSATPEQIRSLFARTIPVGAAFGVVLVLEDGHQFEVATFRNDETYLDGRRPSGVRFGTPQEDAQRRDFTVNGMFYDPLEDKLLDWVGGQADIERRLIRTIGEPRHRFGEDKLRMLRCLRFATTLGYEIEPATFEAVREMAPQISVVSAERIREELVKIFTRAHPGRGLVLLEQSGLLREVLPEVAAMKGVEQPAEFHPEGDVFEHVKLMLDGMPSEPSLTLAFAVLLHDVGKPPTFSVSDRIRFNEHDKLGAEMAETILRRLRFSNEEIERIVLCVAEHMRFRHVQEMRTAKLKRILARPTFADELELHRLDCIASHGSLDNVDFLLKKAAETPPEVVKPKPLVNGRDLLEIGFTTGTLVGAVLREIEELQLEEHLESREAALAYACDRLRGGAPASGLTGPRDNG
ncbi:MAG: CCA tRNA nucleotidyltransferase [Verrucomicrobia bacterium]|nr:CCA tRNA nucleotidyltransferase [Verrucomicrobiota bacterium]